MLCKTSKFLSSMSLTRLQSLISFLEETPNDPFIKYGIALEYEKIGQPEAEHYYKELLTQHPDYLATYYSAGKYYENKEDYDTAEALFEKGIELAKKLGDSKAAGELQTALDLL